MAGNSKRRGAVRKDGTKKGMVVGSGGKRRRALEGRGPTPPAERRPGHPKAAAAKRSAAATRPKVARRRAICTRIAGTSASHTTTSMPTV